MIQETHAVSRLDRILFVEGIPSLVPTRSRTSLTVQSHGPRSSEIAFSLPDAPSPFHVRDLHARVIRRDDSDSEGMIGADTPDHPWVGHRPRTRGVADLRVHLGLGYRPFADGLVLEGDRSERFHQTTRTRTPTRAITPRRFDRRLILIFLEWGDDSTTCASSVQGAMDLPRAESNWPPVSGRPVVFRPLPAVRDG